MKLFFLFLVLLSSSFISAAEINGDDFAKALKEKDKWVCPAKDNELCEVTKEIAAKHVEGIVITKLSLENKNISIEGISPAYKQIGQMREALVKDSKKFTQALSVKGAKTLSPGKEQFQLYGPLK